LQDAPSDERENLGHHVTFQTDVQYIPLDNRVNDEELSYSTVGNGHKFTKVVKQLWSYSREHDLQDPVNRRNICCDGPFHEPFDVDTMDMFQMNRVLAKHIWPLNFDGGASRVCGINMLGRSTDGSKPGFDHLMDNSPCVYTTWPRKTSQAIGSLGTFILCLGRIKNVNNWPNYGMSPYTLEVVLLSRYYPQGSYQLVLSLRVLVEGYRFKDKKVTIYWYCSRYYSRYCSSGTIHGYCSSGTIHSTVHRGRIYLFLERIKAKYIKKRKMKAEFKEEYGNLTSRLFSRHHLEGKVVSKECGMLHLGDQSESGPSPHGKKIMPCKSIP
nr:hypothetical protein [Tanacetum cinerariifolium]